MWHPSDLGTDLGIPFDLQISLYRQNEGEPKVPEHEIEKRSSNRNCREVGNWTGMRERRRRKERGRKIMNRMNLIIWLVMK